MSVNTKPQAPCLPEHDNTCHLNNFVLITMTKQCLQNTRFNYFNNCTVHLLLFFTITNQCTINWQSIIICQLIVHWLVIVQIKKIIIQFSVCRYYPIQQSNLFVHIAQLWGFYFICPAGLSSFCSMNSWTPEGSKCTENLPAFRHKSCPGFQILIWVVLS